MAIPPNIQARLAQLKAEAAMRAEMDRRRQMAQQNAQKSAQALNPVQKAGGGGMSPQDREENLRRFLEMSEIKQKLYRGQRRVPKADKFITTQDRATPSFTSDPEVANVYSRKLDWNVEHGPGSTSVPVYMQSKKPFDIRHLSEHVGLDEIVDSMDHDLSVPTHSSKLGYEDLADILSTLDHHVFKGNANHKIDAKNSKGYRIKGFDRLADEVMKAGEEKDIDRILYDLLPNASVDAYALADSHEMVKQLKKQGYDSMIHKDVFDAGMPYYKGNPENVEEGYDANHVIDAYRPFHQEKIKSAIGNRGTYDISNPDMTKAKGGEVQSDAKLSSDIPNKDWLDDKVEYAKKKGRNEFGAPYMGTLTGTFNRKLKLPVSLLASLKGMRGEQQNVRQGDLAWLKNHMQKTGKLPLLDSGEEYAPFVTVNHSGEPWISEGNHRIMAAKELGMSHLPVEVRYFDGGERAEGKFHPDKLKEHDANHSVQRKASGGSMPSLDVMRLALNKHGMYSPLEKSLMAVPRSKGTPAEFMAEAGKQPGYRAEEVADRKISLPEKKMTKAEMLAHLQKHPMPEIQQKIAGAGVDENELSQRAYDIAYEQARDGILKYYPTAMESADGNRLIQSSANSNFEEFKDEFMRKAADEIGQPEAFHDDYLLPGGENYREVMLKKPEFTGDKQIRDLELELNRVSPEKRVEIMRKITALKDAKERHGEMFPGNPSHFGGEPGILASLRLTDRKGPNGEKILHVEEIQSDWHQAGRKKGYNQLPEGAEVLQNKFGDNFIVRLPNGNLLGAGGNTQEEAIQSAIKHRGGVPDAPFKKSWHEMALKHALGMAVKGGYHGIAITPGEEQANRYSLAKHIDSIMLVPNPYPNKNLPYYFKAFDKQGNRVADDAVNEDKLQEYIGKEPAQQLLSSPENPMGERMISGANIVIGDKGMKGFYDKIVPTFLNKLGKPHGAQVSTINVNSPKEESWNVEDAAAFHGMTGPEYLDSPNRSQLEKQFLQSRNSATKQLHYFPINDSLREQIKTQGLPQYNRGGEVMKKFDDGGAAFGVFPQMKGRRSQQDPVAAANMPVAGALGAAASIPGSFADLLKLGIKGANLSFGPGGVNIPTDWLDPYTTEGILKKMPFQEALQSPAGKAASTLGEIVGGGLSGPAISKSAGPLTDLAWKIKGDVPLGQAGPAVWIGKNSPEFDKLAMLKAERMERAGATPAEIKAATNMERDPIYGSWLQQESLGDLQMRSVPDIKEMYNVDPIKDPISLSQAFGNNTLSSLYPDVFGDMKMLYSYNKGAGSGIIPPRTLSPTDPGQLKINLSQGYKPLEDIAHEAQHGVQFAENMPLSESMMFAHKSPQYENILKEVQANPSAFATEGPDYTKAAYEWYTRQPAEVQARAAAASSGMTPEVRRGTLMSDLYDVPKEKILYSADDIKPITYSEMIPEGGQAAISAANLAGKLSEQTSEPDFTNILGNQGGGGDDMASFFNLIGAPGGDSGGFDFSDYSGEDFAEGGTVNPGGPNIAQMRLSLMKMNPANIKNMGVNESIDVNPKLYMPPETQKGAFLPPGGVATPSGMPIGGIDMSQMQPGQQLMPQGGMQPQGGPQQAPGAPQGQPGMQPPQGMPGAGGQPPMGPQSSILQMTPQGQTLAALGGGQPQAPKPPGMAKGGSAKSVEDMKRELAEKGDQPKRIQINAEGSGGVKGIVVPRHMWEGTKHAEGMKHVNEARAKVYGSEHRTPLTLGQIASTHKKTLNEHFSKPLHEQLSAENEALERLRAAKHIGKTANTLDESEKLDTVRHEHDEHGRTYVGYASKGIAGHALYTSGHGKDMKHHVVNTCAGQTTGCGGGVDEKGIVDTKRGTCFAPNAESQYVNAAVRRASHEQAKHDPAMTKDWILAHTGSLRSAAEKADKKNQVTLFRPNVVDETDVSSRHVINHLNSQRKKEDKPNIVANSYGKTNELHDPENGYYVTHSNVGPKVKKGQEISENIARDKQRVRSTIHASTAGGEDLKNEQGNKTPPKGSYMVTDVKRGSPLSKKMEKHITHAKYWSTGREEHELSKAEREEGPEGHFSGAGRSTTPEKAHYGHTTLNGKRYDYQKQHILHPRLVQVGNNQDGTPHMIPTDSRFKDTDFLPKNRFKTKNGKDAGHILMTTPTESTSNLGHQTSFTHHVNDKHIEHATKNNGEYEIDAPHEQEKAKGKEYAAPQPIKFMAEGGSVGRHPELGDDDFHAFPERNFHAQYHLARRHDPHDSGDDAYVRSAMSRAHRGHKRVALHKNMDTMRLELTNKAK